MNKSKGVRKYGRMGQALRWGKYLAHLFAVMPLSITAMAAYLLGCISTGVFLLLTLVSLCMKLDFESVAGSFVLTLISAGIAAVGKAFQKGIFEAPAGSVLNPAPPTENPLLPVEELLVRASSPSAAQPAELLRATRGTAEQKPEELLRISEQG